MLLTLKISVPDEDAPLIAGFLQSCSGLEYLSVVVTEASDDTEDECNLRILDLNDGFRQVTVTTNLNDMEIVELEMVPDEEDMEVGEDLSQVEVGQEDDGDVS